MICLTRWDLLLLPFSKFNVPFSIPLLDVHMLIRNQAPPNKKLPALYVMDSIVKNVGTPYTLYFGRTLFKIFMESYSVVDHGVRRKMEEMLKTWKDPVPGSMDTRPVFSHELVRPIENALMKVRAASMSQQAQGAIPGRPRSAMFPNRNTPTPPGMRGYAGPAGNFQQQPHPYANGGHPGEPVAGYPGQQVSFSSLSNYLPLLLGLHSDHVCTACSLSPIIYSDPLQLDPSSLPPSRPRTIRLRTASAVWN
jgi:pre-mRNA cleavage complex 2 protein Pcf11